MDQHPQLQWQAWRIILAALLMFAANLSDPKFIPAENLEERVGKNDPGKSAKAELAVVNGHVITEGDLALIQLSASTASSDEPRIRERFIEYLIDQQLVREFLEGRNIDVDSELLDNEIARLFRAMRNQGRDPEKTLADWGYDQDRLRESLKMRLQWQHHVRRVVTNTQIKEYFDGHRRELDGTEVRASQILLKLPTDATPSEIAEREQRLVQLRKDILAERIRFGEAAKEHSEAPSREVEGDLGFFPYQGRMPAEFTSVAFGLREGEVSEPFQTTFGFHLCTVTQIKPGQLSAEDARPEILRRLSDDLWRKVVDEQRAKARIVRKPTTQR